MIKKMKKAKGLIYILPSLIGVMIFYIGPFIQSLKYCFTTGMMEKSFVGLQNFKVLFQNDVYKLAMKNTLLIIGSGLPILFILSVVIALLIEKDLKKYKWLQGILMLPMALPAASLILVWKDLLGSEGLINAILNTNIDWLQSSSAPVFIIILMVWKNLGYNVLLIISSLLSMPKEYEEAASLDGGGDVCIAYHIKIPYIIPTLFFVVVISLFNCFKIFREVFLLQGEYPSDSLYMIQHFMNNNFLKLNYQRLATAAFILYSVIFVIIYVMCYFQEKYIKSLEARG